MCFGDMRWQSVTLQREMNAAHIVSGEIVTIPYSCTAPVESRLTATSLALGYFSQQKYLRRALWTIEFHRSWADFQFGLHGRR